MKSHLCVCMCLCLFQQREAVWERTQLHGVKYDTGPLSAITCSLNTENKCWFWLKSSICGGWQSFSVCVYMSRNFLVLVAVSLLSTKRYYSLTMTRVLLCSSLRVSWTSLFEAFAHVSLYLHIFLRSLPPNLTLTLRAFLSEFLMFPTLTRRVHSTGNLLFLNFLGGVRGIDL